MPVGMPGMGGRGTTGVPLRGAYFTAFGANESPLSEGGNWLGSDSNQTRCVSNGGLAYGTNDYPTSGGSGHYDDSIAFLAGTWSVNQECTATLLKQGSFGGGNRECELFVRTYEDFEYDPSTGLYGLTRTRGYEFNFAKDGSYWNIGLYKGAALISSGGLTIASGDVFKMRVVGNSFWVWQNGVLLPGLPVTDTSGPGGGAMFMRGSPGIGFWRNGDTSADNQLAWTDFSAGSL